MAPESKKNLVYELLRDDIVAGRFPVGSKLPGGLELAKRYQVAHMTVRSAMKRLAAENYVAFINGSGTFVTNRDEKPVYLILSSNLSDFTLPGNYVVPGIQRAMALAGAQTKLCIRDFIARMRIVSLLKESNLWLCTLPEAFFISESVTYFSPCLASTT